MRFVLVFMLMLVCVQITAGWPNLNSKCRKYKKTSCGTGWWRFDKGRCMKFPKYHRLPYSSAEAYCRRRNSHLVSLHSDTETEHLTCLIYYGLKRPVWVWIGARRGNMGFQWGDHSRFDYTSWAKGEPNKRGRCVVTNVRGYGKWKDVLCRFRRGFVCAK